MSSKRNCPVCASTFIKGRRVLLIERDFNTPEPSESIVACVRVICRGCAKLAKRSPSLYLMPGQLEESARDFMNAGKRQSDARAHMLAALIVKKYPKVEHVDDVDERILDFARELEAMQDNS